MSRSFSKRYLMTYVDIYLRLMNNSLVVAELQRQNIGAGMRVGG